MEYVQFKDKHVGQKIIVCGCGESTNLIGKVSAKNPITIGVNDICRLFTPSYLVVLNDKVGFNEDRWRWIKNSTAPYCFTQMKKLDTASQRVLIKLGKHGGSESHKTVDYTANSPYVASLIAAHMGAKEIGLIGVDFTEHHFFEKTGVHTLAPRLPQIRQEYESLRKAFESRGIRLVNLSPVSKVGLGHVDIEQFII